MSKDAGKDYWYREDMVAIKDDKDKVSMNGLFIDSHAPTTTRA